MKIKNDHWNRPPDPFSMLEKQGIANPLMVQSLEKGRRNEVLRSAKLFGAGIRQLSRLTGVSFGVIQKI